MITMLYNTSMLMYAKVLLYGFLLMSSSKVNERIALQDQATDYVQVSVDFLNALKEHQPVDEYIKLLSESTIDLLDTNLNTQNKRLSFWINIYNAFIQVRLTENPKYFEDRRSFFKQPLIDIAGKKMSFADIEHGLIRRSQMELFLGYIGNPFPSKYEKTLRVFKRDHRIHFALNCGAKSCPPVAIYSADNLNKELDIIATKFLETFSSYNSKENLVTSTALFSWFRGDFGGSDGIREILKSNGIVPSTDVRVKVSEYDWTLYLDNFIEF